MGGWAWDDEPPSPDALRLLDNARRLYDRIAEITAAAVADPADFRIDRGLILDFHAIATAGEQEPDKEPGAFRSRDVVIAARGVVLYEPPPANRVPELVDAMCVEIERRWNIGSTLNAAAFALWRLNWIHPFGDGNGKTARALMYTILCVGFGRMLPGEVALPDLIASEPRRYWSALKAADRSCARGQIDVSDAEAMLVDLIERILPTE